MESSQGVSEQQVAHMARLARLALSEGESEMLRDELSSIIHYIDKLAEVDCGDVTQATWQPPGTAPLRQDRVVLSDVAQQVLQQAPQRLADSFAVPRVIDAEGA